jgi:hypothetical protein
MSLHVLQLAHRQLPQQDWQCTCSVCKHLDKLRFMDSGLDNAPQTPWRGEGPQTPHNITICCVLFWSAFRSCGRRTAPWIPVNRHGVISLTFAAGPDYRDTGGGWQPFVYVTADGYSTETAVELDCVFGHYDMWLLTPYVLGARVA